MVIDGIFFNQYIRNGVIDKFVKTIKLQQCIVLIISHIILPSISFDSFWLRTLSTENVHVIRCMWRHTTPLINTSTHVLQIQLCHLQFPNCPRQTRPSHCWSRARPDHRDAESWKNILIFLPNSRLEARGRDESRLKCVLFPPDLTGRPRIVPSFSALVGQK